MENKAGSNAAFISWVGNCRLSPSRLKAGLRKPTYTLPPRRIFGRSGTESVRHGGRNEKSDKKFSPSRKRCIWKMDCRRPDSNRHGSNLPRDFKSLASTTSATPA